MWSARTLYRFALQPAEIAREQFVVEVEGRVAAGTTCCGMCFLFVNRNVLASPVPGRQWLQTNVPPARHARRRFIWRKPNEGAGLGFAAA